jgi:hypothetical protein
MQASVNFNGFRIYNVLNLDDTCKIAHKLLIIERVVK